MFTAKSYTYSCSMKWWMAPGRICMVLLNKMSEVLVSTLIQNSFLSLVFLLLLVFIEWPPVLLHVSFIWTLLCGTLLVSLKKREWNALLSVGYETSTAQVLFIVTMLQHINNVVFVYGNLFYWFCLYYSPVSGAPIDDEYNLQDHSDLYILDLGKQGFNLNELRSFLLNPVFKILEKELLRF